MKKRYQQNPLITLYVQMPDTSGTMQVPYELRFFTDFARIASKRAKDTSYLFVHGIVEPEEVPTRLKNDQARSWAFERSVERSREVYYLLQREKAIGSYAEKDPDRLPNVIPAKYAIAYGTGDTLYISGARTVGRVDLVMFIGDISKETQRELIEVQNDSSPARKLR